jgi:hypothetical protein
MVEVVVAMVVMWKLLIVIPGRLPDISSTGRGDRLTHGVERTATAVSRALVHGHPGVPTGLPWYG